MALKNNLFGSECLYRQA